MTKIQLFNGRFLPEDDEVLRASNRGYCYGDGFFETVRVANGAALFTDRHWKRLLAAVDCLRLQLPVEFSAEVFKDHVQELCQKNRLPNARVRFHAFREGQGTSVTDNAQMGWGMTCAELPTAAFQLNKKGIVLGICPTVQVQHPPISSFKSSSALPYVIAGMYARKMNWDDCLLLNNKGFIAEATFSNLFLISEGRLLTPDLQNGGVHGVMRSVVLDMAANAGLAIHEKQISETDVLNAEECFLTNAIRGIQWVSGMGRKRFYRKRAEELQQMLNGQCGLS